MTTNRFILCSAIALVLCSCNGKIDREALVTRNNPHVTEIDALKSLSVGNGKFAFTADATGLQTFPELYRLGVPLGTQSQWGWHSFANPEDLKFEETLRSYDFGRGHEELYACQLRGGRGQMASDWYRVNPHRLHLGCIGFDGLDASSIKDIDQTLNMWNGVLNSKFTSNGTVYEVQTSCDPDSDLVAVKLSDAARTPIIFRFPYPTGQHADDACDWNKDELHSTEIIAKDVNFAIVKRTLDETVYYVKISWCGDASIEMAGKNSIRLTPAADTWMFSTLYSQNMPKTGKVCAGKSQEASQAYWQNYWQKGGVVDFSKCKDPRAPELERRVVLSQYLLAIQCAAENPPQETGLTYNSWYGKPHLEMTWWHEAQFPLWGHEDLLARLMPWYESAEPVARSIAERQGFKGVRWMKMTDPSAIEAPSNVGSFLIWQQPHYIYMAELLRRAGMDPEPYYDLVQKTAEFMADFATYDEANDRYVLKGCIAAQETLQASKTINPPFELSYWHFALEIAQEWRERKGLGRVPEWDEVISKLSPLASKDGLYLAAETEPDTYSNIRMYSDHMAVLDAYGVLPKSPQFEDGIMNNTLDWVMANWNWDETWGWDFPTTCMNATRLMEPEKAIDAILMDQRTNTYLVSGHNYQNERLRCYMPGNGGLLTAVALMTAGWDGCTVKNPGFPKNGQWNVRWEGIRPLP